MLMKKICQFSDILDIKHNELQHQLEQHQHQLKESFIQKVIDKEAELKETKRKQIMSADNYNNFECSAVFLEDYGRGYDTISSRHRQCPSTSSGSIFYSSWLARKCLVISAGNKRSKTYHQQNVEYDGNDIDPKSDEQGSQGIDVKSAMEIDTDKQHDDQTVLEPVKRINEKLKEKTDDKIYHLYMGISDINNYQEFYEQTNIVQGNTNSNLVRNKGNSKRLGCENKQTNLWRICLIDLSYH
ncbi:unnamed protein product [Rotaria sp. Silwood1]|nr:unnamed protein product [Rotaria sp. Silwood1]